MMTARLGVALQGRLEAQSALHTGNQEVEKIRERTAERRLATTFSTLQPQTGKKQTKSARDPAAQKRPIRIQIEKPKFRDNQADNRWCRDQYQFDKEEHARCPGRVNSGVQQSRLQTRAFPLVVGNQPGRDAEDL